MTGRWGGGRVCHVMTSGPGVHSQTKRCQFPITETSVLFKEFL